MLIEASHLLGVPVVNEKQKALGRVDILVFDAADAKIAGMQIEKNGVIKKFAGLFFDDLVNLSRTGVATEDGRLQTDLTTLDSIAKTSGKVIGVTAMTESGQALGKVSDVVFEAETGAIVRFELRHLLRERLIPRQFLVSITPQKIIFQDVVNEPVFDKLATEPVVEPAL